MLNFIVKPRPEDYVLGSSSPITFKAVNPSGTWVNRLEFFESQSFDNQDTNGCVIFSCQESFDSQMDLLIANGTIPSDVVAQFRSMGYMDLGRDGLAHFHSSPRFLQILTRNGFNGNSAPEPWDVIRANGVLPFTDLPYNASITHAEYLTGITPAMTAKASQFLSIMGGKNSTQYHWVFNDSPRNNAVLTQALQQAPLIYGIAVNDAGWNQVTPTDPPASQAPQHAVMGYAMNGQSCDILDHYIPYLKVLDPTYPIHFTLQGIVTYIAPVEQQIVSEATVIATQIQTTPATPTQKIAWYQSLVAILQSLLSAYN